MKKITKKEVDAAYKNPVDPFKPFERLELLLGFAMQELYELRKPKKQCPDCEGKTDQVSECCGASIDSDILISISMGLANNSAMENTRDGNYDGEGLSISEGGGGPLIAAALMNNFTHDMSGSATSRLPAI